MARALDLAGMRFGTLTAKERAVPRPEGQAYKWLCLCDCGKVVSVSAGNLRNGHTKSCGLSCSMKVHHLRGTPTETSWKKMLSRVQDPNLVWYKDVTVCDRWNPSKGGSFENFVEDMGERPEGCTLNRIRGANMYSKDTCEWATLSVQSFDRKPDPRNTSGKTGVKWREDKQRWEARIGVDNEVIILYFGDSYDLAVRARKEAELKYYGFIKQ